MAGRRPHRPPNRTTALPASLREELEGLGHLQPKGRSRKEKRKLQREAKKGRKGNGDGDRSQQAKKRPVEPASEPEVELEQPQPKKLKIAAEPVEKVKVKKQTDLERLLAKQEGPVRAASGKRTKKVETDEDREIAWLEAKLGLQAGRSKEKGKWREEIEEDGLDGQSLVCSYSMARTELWCAELFAGMDDLEEAAFGNPKKVGSKCQSRASSRD